MKNRQETNPFSSLRLDKTDLFLTADEHIVTHVSREKRTSTGFAGLFCHLVYPVHPVKTLFLVDRVHAWHQPNHVA